jgi:hypothetical protein
VSSSRVTQNLANSIVPTPILHAFSSACKIQQPLGVQTLRAEARVKRFDQRVVDRLAGGREKSSVSDPKSLLRVLQNISAQTLEPTDFEVVVVDDGSDPPVQAVKLNDRFHFPIRLLRRTGQSGAHESRFAGLRSALIRP